MSITSGTQGMRKRLHGSGPTIEEYPGRCNAQNQQQEAASPKTSGDLGER
ncbi:hypothetical protein CyaNS01_00198 [Cyanobium sp. NS01]|nr:hypothetical protein CyaNS01_00198 [Cyanobium sp. NS01]